MVRAGKLSMHEEVFGVRNCDKIVDLMSCYKISSIDHLEDLVAKPKKHCRDCMKYYKKLTDEIINLLSPGKVIKKEKITPIALDLCRKVIVAADICPDVIKMSSYVKIFHNDMTACVEYAKLNKMIKELSENELTRLNNCCDSTDLVNIIRNLFPDIDKVTVCIYVARNKKLPSSVDQK